MSHASKWRDGERVRDVVLEPLAPGRWRATVDGQPIDLTAEVQPDGRLRLVTDQGVIRAEVTVEGSRRFVRLGAMDFVFEAATGAATARPRARGAAGAGLEAPMPGVVTRVLVAEGEAVRQGQPLVALEAMKMEHLIRAPYDGRVMRLAARQGELVQGGVALVELEGESGSAGPC